MNIEDQIAEITTDLVELEVCHPFLARLFSLQAGVWETASLLCKDLLHIQEQIKHLEHRSRIPDASHKSPLAPCGGEGEGEGADCRLHTADPHPYPLPGQGEGANETRTEYLTDVLEKKMADRLMISWLDYPVSIHGKGYCLIIFFVESLHWSQMALFNKQWFLQRDVQRASIAR